MDSLMLACAGIGLVLVIRICVAQEATFPDVFDLPSQKDLPDPLVMFDGARVATKEDWIRKRRPELKALFQPAWNF